MSYSTPAPTVFGEPALAALAADGTGQTITYPANTVLIAAGDDSDHVLVLLDGHVAIRTDNGQIVAVAGPGEVVGEVAALNSPPRSASVVSVSPVTARLVAAQDWRDWLASYPGAAMTQLMIAQERLSAATRRLAATPLSALTRVAQTLVELTDLGIGTTDEAGAVTITWPQADLAAMAGVSRESVIIAVRQLKQAGIVSTGRGSTTIRDLAALRDWATGPVEDSTEHITARRQARDHFDAIDNQQ